MARDFFRFQAAKHGTAVFREGGLLGKAPTWRGGEREFQLWANGCTGFPLVDANMRELQATGWMSNRGRQNVASFLALDLGVDWRRGADWFERWLIDYDVCSNWCNWVSAAGLGNGRVMRFNVLRQSMMYDPEGNYLRHWLPELRGVPASKVQEPWTLTESEREVYAAKSYPQPCLDPTIFPTGTKKSRSGGGDVRKATFGGYDKSKSVGAKSPVPRERGLRKKDQREGGRKVRQNSSPPSDAELGKPDNFDVLFPDVGG